MRSLTLWATIWALLLPLGRAGSAGAAGGDAVSQATAASSAGSPADPNQTNPAAVKLEDVGLQAYWRTRVKLAFRERIVSMHVLDENLYCFMNKGRLVAIDAKRGLTKWEYQVAGRDETIFRPSHPAVPVVLRVGVGENRKEITFNAVVLNTVTRLMVLDRDKGTEIRNVPLGSPANAAGASDGRNIFIGSLKGLYHCFTLDKGVLAWTRKTDAMISVPLAYYNNHIYVASEDHTFYVSKNDPNGTKVWQQKLGGSVIAAFEVEDRGCFVPCEDGRVYAFHPMTGDKVWDPFLCRARLTTPVQVGRGAVFQYAKGDKFYAINIGNGGELWSLPEGRMVLAVIEDDVYLLDKDGNLRIITERKGKLKAVVPLDRLTVFAPNTKLPAMYGASDSGWVVCISPISQGYITPEMLLKKD